VRACTRNVHARSGSRGVEGVPLHVDLVCRVTASVYSGAIDWRDIIGDVARALLGEPNTRLSSDRELRYGSRGSLVVHVNGNRRGSWWDFESNEGGGVLDLIDRECRCGRAGAMRWLREHGIIENTGESGGFSCPKPRSRPAPRHTSRPAARRRKDTRAFALRIWDAARPLAGTVAEAYLEVRGVGHVASAPALRFHRSITHPDVPEPECFPALVAVVQGADGRLNGVHRTYLRADGTGKADLDSAPARLSLGPIGGGAVRILETAGDALLLGEGIETTSAAVKVLGWRCGAWAALSTSGLRAVVLPKHVHHVTIAADRDAKGGGQLAAAALGERLMEEGRSVAIKLPPFVGDWCDVLAMARHAE